MAEGSWPGPNHAARAVNDVEYEQLMATFAPDGMVGTYTDTPLVYADSSGMQVKLRANRFALVHGHPWTSGTVDIAKPVTANSSGQVRTDIVVLGLDRTTWDVTAYVKAGTPGGGPPVLQRDNIFAASTGKWEVAIATVTVASGISSVPSTAVSMVGWWITPHPVATTYDAHSWVPHAPGRVMTEIDVGNRFVSENNSWVLLPDVNGVARLIASKRITSGNVYTNSNAAATIASLPVPVVAGRSYEIRLDCTASTGDGRAPLQIAARLFDGSSPIGDTGIIPIDQAGWSANVSLTRPYSAGSTGTRTISAQAFRTGGTANFDVLGSPTYPCWLRVYDLGTTAI